MWYMLESAIKASISNSQLSRSCFPIIGFLVSGSDSGSNDFEDMLSELPIMELAPDLGPERLTLIESEKEGKGMKHDQGEGDHT